MRAEFTSIGAGFDKLPALTGNANKAVVVNAGGTSLTVTTGALSLAGAFTLTGGHALTITTTGTSSITVPTTGTLATLAGSENLTNKTLTSPIITTSPTAAGATWTDLGSVTTIDINGGTIDGAVIGGSSAAAGSFTTLGASSTLSVTGDATIGTSVASTRRLLITSNSSQDRQVNFQSAGVDRWIIQVNNTAESGGNAGSNFNILARDDTGAAIGAAINIARSTMAVTLAGALSVNGNTTLGDASGDTLTINAGTWTQGNNVLWTRAAGTVGAGAQHLTQYSASATGDAGGTTDVRGMRVQITTGGANAITTSMALFVPTNHGGSATLGNASGIFAQMSPTSTGNITTARNFDSTFVLGTAGSITTASNFVARSPIFSSSGTITTHNGLLIQNLGNTLVTTAVGVQLDDFTNSTNMYGINSAMSSGSNKFFLRHSGTADSVHTGNFRIGSTTAPTVALDVTGAVLVSSTAGITGTLSANTITVLSGTTATVYNATATTVNAFGAATTLTVGAAASATTWTGQSFALTGANSTNNTALTVTNTSNAAAASHSYVDVSVGGTTSTGDPQLRLTIPGGTSWYVASDNSASDTLIIGTGTAVGTNARLSVDTSGNATLAGLLTLTAGQIAFPATQNPSSDANTLDDYEEGAFTPTLIGTSTAGTQTYDTQVGKYTKIGNVVYFTIYVDISAKDAGIAGSVAIGGLPFTANNTANTQNAVAISQRKGFDLNTGSNYLSLVGSIWAGESQIRLFESGDNNESAAIGVAAMAADSYIIASGHYFV